MWYIQCGHICAYACIYVCILKNISHDKNLHRGPVVPLLQGWHPAQGPPAVFPVWPSSGCWRTCRQVKLVIHLSRGSHMAININIYIYVCVCAYIYIYTYVNIYIYICICIFICICISICIYIYVYVYVYNPYWADDNPLFEKSETKLSAIALRQTSSTLLVLLP